MNVFTGWIIGKDRLMPSSATDRIKTNDRILPDHLRAVLDPARNIDRIARLENYRFAIHREPKPPGENGIDLIDAVGMRTEIGSR